MKFTSHDEYFSTQPAAIREILEGVQREVESRVPDAMRIISYNMPCFKKNRTFFYFAAFKKHIGIYPPITDDAALIDETAKYRGPKGNLVLPYSQGIPMELVGRVAAALAAQYSSR